MCGIAGVLNAASREEGARIVAAMNAQIVHRGPDDEGTWVGERAAVGMRRLSIIDVSGGHQPMTTEDGVVIVFNGEIYNYRALRAGLERDGYRFRTQSDTEVILNLYHRGGLAALEALEGMYGICLVDPRSRNVHLLRDRLGIKPLYYGQFDGRFYFASEIKAILAPLAQRPEIDSQSIHDFLYLRYVPAPRTVWQGILKLPPGHRLTYRLDDRAWQIERYWKAHFQNSALDPGRDYVSEFRDRFVHAVESHITTADVPVGTLLSGGIDSSAVAAAAAEVGIRGLHSFTVGFDDGGEYSEFEFARETAQHIGADHHEVVIGKRQFLDFLPEFVWYSDEPIADLASVPLYYVARLAREHVKVVISGEGADEVLAGYNFHEMVRDTDARAQIMRFVPRQAFSLAAHLASGDNAKVLRAMGADGWTASLKARATSPTVTWSGAKLEALWRDKSALPVQRIIDGWYDGCDSREPIDLLQHAWCQDWLVEDLLMKADKMTMANSIELRVPFLTHSFVEWAQTLPAVWRVGDRSVGYVSKRILRAFAERCLPSRIVNRPKRGFPVPAYQWLTHEDVGAWATAQLSNRQSRMYQWLDVETALSELQSARAGDTGAAHRVWTLLILDEWLRRWT